MGSITTPSTSLVFFCSEDDDLDLVGLVHAARNRGFEPEVVPGVERCDDPLVQAFRRFRDALFVVFESTHLGHARAAEAEDLFERGRQLGQQMILMPLRPDAPDAMLEDIERALAHWSRASKSPDAGPDAR